MIRIRAEAGPAAGRVFDLTPDKDSIVGRAPQSDLAITDPHLSSSHGVFHPEGGRLFFRDLQSRNGSCLRRAGETTVIDEAVHHEVELKAGDEVLLGDLVHPTLLRIESLALPSAAGEPGGGKEPGKEGEGGESPTTVTAVRKIDDPEGIGRSIRGDTGAMEALLRLTRDLTTALDRQFVLKRVSEAIFEVFPQATHVCVQLRRGAASPMEPGFVSSRDGASGSPARTSQTITRAVVEGREAILFHDARERFGQSESVATSHILSGVAIPLWNRREVTGVLQIDNRRLPGAFEPRDLDMLALLGVHLAHMLDNLAAHEKLKADEQGLRDENARLRRMIAPTRPFEGIIGTSPPMQALFRLMEKVLDKDTTILILGETGTGKELVARALHTAGRRRDKPFVAENCAAMPEGLIESALFGHVRGAFTEAIEDRKGVFELADGGTLFLDEVGETSPAMQVKLLRVLQESEVTPVGGAFPRRVDVRIVAATNRDLAEDVRTGRFRADLFFRLSILPLTVPPLRDRREDIPLIAVHLLERYAKKMGKPARGFTPEAMSRLIACPFPGNVRELENEVERAVALSSSEDQIGPGLLSERVRGAEEEEGLGLGPEKLKTRLSRVEDRFVRETLERCGWNRKETARQLGISRVALFKKMNRLGIKVLKASEE